MDTFLLIKNDRGIEDNRGGHCFKIWKQVTEMREKGGTTILFRD